MIVGIIGGGQLGRMLALAGLRLGVRSRVLAPSDDCPAAAAAEIVTGDYADPAAVDRLIDGCNVVTYEFENVPVATARHAAKRCGVFPGPAALEVAQDRLAEKTLFTSLDIDTPDYIQVDDRAGLTAALDRVGLPAVLKTRRYGYDGKGQFVIRGAAALDAAWAALGGQPLILERFVAFERELSIIAARGRGGETAYYPLVETRHTHGILHRAICPAPRATALQARAEDAVRRLLERLDYVGVIALEMFEVDGKLLANEFAPRVHNSGHGTIECAEVSQFENHLRAVCGWPLGSTTVVSHAAMLNLIGAAPALDDLLRIPHLAVHLYDKSPRPGRKIGHVTVRAATPEQLSKRLAEIEPIFLQSNQLNNATT